MTRGMNILVTGGCGFIGSNFVRHALADAGTESVLNLDKLTYAGNPANLAGIERDPRYRFVRGDIGDESLVSELLLRHRVDAVVNFAAESHVDRSIDSPEPFVQTNVVGTLRLLNAARRHWLGLPGRARDQFRFLHVSTDEVYGTLGPGDPPFTESTPYAPNSPYAASKAASDHLVRSFRHTYGFPALTTNCSNNYGPYHFPEKLFPLVILNALDGRPLPIYGDGRQVRDWLYVGDHCRAVTLVLQKGRPGETYNVGGGSERANIDAVRLICSLLDARAPRPDGQPYARQITHVEDRPGHDRRYAIDGAKIRAELGWAPLESFESGLAKTVDWFVSNRAWCEEITSGRYARERLGRPELSASSTP
jgi:dTDP-glucose 4,6-dehydratase